MTEEEKFWNELKDESFDAIQAILTRLEEKLKAYSPKEAFEYLKPVRYLLCEAEMQLDHERGKRIDGADDILKDIL